MVETNMTYILMQPYMFLWVVKRCILQLMNGDTSIRLRKIWKRMAEYITPI